MQHNHKSLLLTFVLAFLGFLSHAQQNLIPIPNHVSTYTGFTRGFYFIAPSDFYLTSFKLPTDASSTGKQAVAVLKFTGTPVTGQGTLLGKWFNIGANDSIDTAIVIKQGDVIGILGNRWTATGNFNAINSYASSGNTTIDGSTVKLNRFGYQGNIAAGFNSSTTLVASTSGSIGRVNIYWSKTPPSRAGNDALVSAIDSPVTFCAGTQSIWATVKNGGINQIKSLTVNWSINGVKQTAQGLATTLDTLKGTGSSFSKIRLGSHTFTSGKVDTIKVWTSDPNGAKDTTNKNDTLQVLRSPSLSGTFSVGNASANYPKVSDAANAVTKYGVCGPVVFNIAAGTYNERVVLGKIAGVSSTNTVVFQGPNSGTATISSSSSSSMNMNTITLDGSDYVTFKDLTVQARGPNFGIGFMLTGGADHNQLLNNKISLNVGSKRNFTSGIAISGSPRSPSINGINGSYNLIKDNFIEGGYYGIRLQGSSSINKDKGNQIIDNVFNRQYYYGISAYYEDEIVIKGNTVGNLRNRFNYPVYLNFPSNFTIDGNYLSGYYYLRVYYGNSSFYNGTPSIVSNNMVISSNSYSLYSYRTQHTNYYHNTFHTVGSYSGYFYYNTNVDVQNNIFTQDGNTYVIYQTNGINVTFDYNIYHSFNSSGIALDDGKSYPTLSSWQSSVSTNNQNSIEINPQYKSSSDLHLSNNVTSMSGLDLGIEMDIDGDKRCPFAPIIGADEIRRLVKPPTANFNVPDTVWQGSPTSILSSVSNSDLADVKWYVNGQAMSDSNHLEFVSNNVGIDTISLVVTNCGGSDSLAKIAAVFSTKRKPNADFIVSDRTPYIGDILDLVDVSDNGATSYTWDITPKFFYNPSFGVSLKTYEEVGRRDTNTAFPRIVFDRAGDYEICLTATNSFGSDKVCKSSHIKVSHQDNFCALINRTDAKRGTLYDNGGKLGDYTPGQSGANQCSYLIQQCDGDVSLNLSEFNLGSDDYLRIYDGEDKLTGTPLWDISAFPSGMTGSLKNKSVFANMTAQSGSAYIEFTSDNDALSTGSGFALNWEVSPSIFTKPSVNFNIPDTGCYGLPLAFSSPKESGIYYSWDVLDNGNIDNDDPEYSHTFSSIGIFKVQLIAQSICAGSDSITKNVLIEMPSKAVKPRINFTRNVVNAGDTMTISGVARYCVENWRWEITPSHFTFTDGASASDQDVSVRFEKAGLYDVKLVAINSYGKDSVVKTKAIKVLDYCKSVSAGLDFDIAISRVTFNTIDHTSDMGINSFSDFTSTSTMVEIGHQYAITVERNSADYPVSRKVWIDFNVDGDFEDLGELVASQSSSKDTSWTDSIKIPVDAPGGLTRMRVGITYKNQKLTSCGPVLFGEFEDYGILIDDVDRTNPVLTLKGSLYDTVEVFSNWTDPGSMATDLVDGNVSSKVITTSNLDTDVIGDYEITYSVTDNGNNTDSETRLIHVRDTVSPVIQLAGDSSVYIEALTSYFEAGVVASDNYDRNLTITTFSNLDTATVGTYTIKYCVTDLSGNGAICVSREVIVGDSTKPTITLDNPNHDTIEVNMFYLEPGFTANDNYTAHVVVDKSGSWPGSPSILGTFELIYTATDDAGNTASISKLITVVDSQSPVITLRGNISDTVYRWKAYVDPLYTINDNYADSVDVTVVTGGDFVSTTSLGSYFITHQATDASGNVSPTVARVIHVVEDVTTGILPNGLRESLDVYPNPSSGQFTLKTSGKVEITTVKVYDINSRLVYQSDRVNINENGTNLDLGFLESGTYILKTTTLQNNASSINRIIISK